MATSIASYIVHNDPSSFHSIASFLGTFIGGVTLTGSIAAFIKLANVLRNKNLTLPMSHLLNKPLALTSLGALLVML